MSDPVVEAAPLPSNQSASTGLRHWLRHVIGLDRAVGFTVLARLWASSAGLVTVALIARFLSPAEQGYYYTFGSLVAMQMIFELGFSFVILQLASHERAQLSISTDNQISGDPVDRPAPEWEWLYETINRYYDKIRKVQRAPAKEAA